MNTEVTKKDTITLSLVDIAIIEFKLSSRAYELEFQLPYENYEFQFHIQLNFDESQQLALLPLRVTLYEKDNKIELAQLKIRATFKILNFEEVIKKVDGQFKFPTALISITAGVTVSTARGIFFMNVRDTILKNALMPIVDPSIFSSVEKTLNQ